MKQLSRFAVALALVVPAAAVAQGVATTTTSGPGAARVAPRVQSGAPQVSSTGRSTTSGPAEATDASRRAQAPAPSARAATHTLSSTRKVFSDTDADKDGVISEREATAVGVSKVQFGAFDADGDAKITADEFVVGYRQLVAEAGHAAAPDLEAEATRLQSLRRAQVAQSERQREGRVGTEPTIGGTTARRLSGADATPERVRAADGGVAPTARSQDTSRGTVGRTSADTNRAAASGGNSAGSQVRGAAAPVPSPRADPSAQRPAPAERGAGTATPAPARPSANPNARPAPQPRPQQSAPRPATPRPAPRPSGPSGRN